MKTTSRGFLEGFLRRIPRHGVKALAAGALLAAAALPLAVATEAGAAGAITSIYVCTDAATCSGNGTQTISEHLASFGTGASGEIQINGSDFAYDGGNVTVTSTAPGVTFSNASESSATEATVSFQSSASTLPGTYNLTLVDDANTGIVATGVLTVNPGPTISSVSLVSASDDEGNYEYTDVISGTGFVSLASASFVSEVNNTELDVVSTDFDSPTQVTVEFYAENNQNYDNATPGAWDLTVTNPDGGTTTDAPALTIYGLTIDTFSPSALPPIAETASVNVSGTGFQEGAQVTFSLCGGITNVSTIYNSPTSLTVTFTQAGGYYYCEEEVANPSVANGGNAAYATVYGGLTFGFASSVAPTVTKTSDTTAIVPGSPSQEVTFTGTGLSQYTTAEAYVGTSTTPASGVTLSDPTGDTGTSVTFLVTVTSADTTLAGADSIVLKNGHHASGESAPFPAGLTIAGPVITSQSPSDIPTNEPVGSIITLTGTGFTPTLTGSVSAGSATGLTGVIDYVNATTIDLVITGSPSATDSPTPATVSVEETLVGGSGTAGSQAFDLNIGAGPTVTSIVYATGTTGVGVGANGQVITLLGSNFKTGVTVSTFKNANGTADASVTAKVLGINVTGTALSVAISIAAGDTNIADGFTVTNTDTGSFTASATGASPLIIQPAPTLTSVTPATASANTTVAFTVAGSGFASGAAVSASADGTCGSTTFVSSTSLSVTCTFGAATTAASLVVTNPNGGSATSAAVLAAATAAAAGAPHATGEAGDGIIGRTVDIAVAGVGFFGQPSVTSTGNSVKAVVIKDTGTLLTVQVTVGTSTGAGEHTLTFTLANGDVFKVNYAIIK